MKLQDAINRHGAPGFFYRKPGVNDNKGVFSFTQLVNAKGKFDGKKVEEAERCDRKTGLGPTGFHEWNADLEICTCGRTEQPYLLTGHHYVRFDNMTALFPVMEFLPYSVLMYMELENLEDEVSTIQDFHTEHARTLQEILKLILEWDFAYVELGSREHVAEVCHGIVSVWDMPAECAEWLMNEMPAEKVGRFLMGFTDARVRPTEPVPDIPDALSEWIYEKIMSCRQIGEYR